MNLDESGVEALISELIEENALACRAFLTIARTEFTTDVPTAAVSLDERPVLRINLDFVRKHCATEQHVKALLVHEFLHVLLRHTLEIRRMNEALNIALDAVINAMIHRQLGEAYSDFMATYYANAPRAAQFLRPLRAKIDVHPECGECRLLTQTDPERAKRLAWLGSDGWTLWRDLYEGKAVYQDVLEFLKAKQVALLEGALESDDQPIWLGNHADTPLDPDDLPPSLLDRLRETAQVLAAKGLLPGQGVPAPGQKVVPPSLDPAVVRWEAQTLALLRRMVTPDPTGGVSELTPARSYLPILSSSDRRGVLRSLWNPIVSENEWPSWRRKPSGSVAVYLDVSGSMNRELERLVRLLHRFDRYLRRPFHAFATTVEPARIERGKLITNSTGGTSLACVFDHLHRTRPAKALVITDGYVEQMHPDKARIDGVRVHFLISAGGTDHILRAYSHPISRLPELGISLVRSGCPAASR